MNGAGGLGQAERGTRKRAAALHQDIAAVFQDPAHHLLDDVRHRQRRGAPVLTAGVGVEAQRAARAAFVPGDQAAGRGAEPIFLSVRLSRLAAAAGDAVAAAGAGDFTQLSRHLRRFEALTSAIWAVQDASG